MRWKKKPTAKLGDQETICRFLWRPLTLEGETRWLERASIVREVVKDFDFVPGCRMPFYFLRWENKRWDDRKPLHWVGFECECGAKEKKGFEVESQAVELFEKVKKEGHCTPTKLIEAEYYISPTP